jgi:hypothetical protein
MKAIRNSKELLAHFDCASQSALKKAIYKSTDCGAWIEFEQHRIVLGSIVEGCDFGTATYPLTYPFTSDDFDARIKAIEAEADALWKWANESDESGETPIDQGIDAPDVDFDYRHLGPEGRSA